MRKLTHFFGWIAHRVSVVSERDPPVSDGHNSHGIMVDVDVDGIVLKAIWGMTLPLGWVRVGIAFLDPSRTGGTAEAEATRSSIETERTSVIIWRRTNETRAAQARPGFCLDDGGIGIPTGRKIPTR